MTTLETSPDRPWLFLEYDSSDHRAWLARRAQAPLTRGPERPRRFSDADVLGALVWYRDRWGASFLDRETLCGEWLPECIGRDIFTDHWTSVGYADFRRVGTSLRRLQRAGMIEGRAGDLWRAKPNLRRDCSTPAVPRRRKTRSYR